MSLLLDAAALTSLSTHIASESGATRLEAAELEGAEPSSLVMASQSSNTVDAQDASEATTTPSEGLLTALAHAGKQLESLLTTSKEWESIWRSSGEPVEIIHVGMPEVQIIGSIPSVVVLSLNRFGSWSHDFRGAMDEASLICRSAEAVLIDDKTPIRVRRSHHKWRPRRGHLLHRILKQVSKFIPVARRLLPSPILLACSFLCACSITGSTMDVGEGTL